MSAHAVRPLAAVENQYSMMWREPEQGLFDQCATMNIAFVAYSPLGNGFLSDLFTRDSVYEKGDFRSFMRRFSPAVMEHNQVSLNLVRRISEDKQAPLRKLFWLGSWRNALLSFLFPARPICYVSRKT